MSDEKKTSMVGKFGEGKGNPTAYKNSGLAGMNPPNPTELRERMTFLSPWFDMELKKPASLEEFKTRTTFYFERCKLFGRMPRLQSYALALGVCRDTLSNWKRSESSCPPGFFKPIKKAMSVIDALTIEELTAETTKNIVGKIFYCKTTLGYQETTRVEVTATDPLGERITGDRLKEIEDGLIDV